jgi:hypothetical protein
MDRTHLNLEVVLSRDILLGRARSIIKLPEASNLPVNISDGFFDARRRNGIEAARLTRLEAPHDEGQTAADKGDAAIG